jgi:restriction system protein
VAIPDFQSLMRPLLLVLSDRQEHPVQNIRDALARQFGLTDDELEERLPSGRTKTYVNRVAWALSHFKGAALVESPRRGVYRITERGQHVLEETASTERIDLRVLSAYPEYRQFRSQDGDEVGGTSTTGAVLPAVAPGGEAAVGTPAERMEAAFREMRRALAVDVLERVREQTPDFFEQVVLDVLQAIGYGMVRLKAALTRHAGLSRHADEIAILGDLGEGAAATRRTVSDLAVISV